MIDIVLLLTVAVVAWCVASEGAYGAAETLLIVIFSGLLAMNFFEPVAVFLQSTLSSGDPWQYYWDMVALVGLFALAVFGLRALGAYLAPTYIQVQRLVHDVGRWACGVLTGYVTMAILLTALHTAPLPREFIGFRPERKNFLGTYAPDRQWLGFTQYVSERVFPRGRIFDGPRYEVGSHPNHVWPSFPIRYAMRREQYAAGGGGGGPAEKERRRIEPQDRGGGEPGF